MDRKVHFQSLDAATITEKIAMLSVRVEERFPQSDLFAISKKLLEVSERATDQIASTRRQLVIGIVI